MLLHDIYEQWRLRAASEVTEIAEAFFPPLLVQQPDDWADARHRVAFIGQETLGWTWSASQATQYRYFSWAYEDIESLNDFINYDRGVEALMDGYRIFDFSSHQPVNYRSPFWSYFRQVKRTIEEKGESVSMLFSNIIRCAANSEDGFTLWSISESDRRRYLQWQHGLLQTELAALQPTLILFVTGPYYDEYLRSELNDLTFAPLAVFQPRQLSKLSSTALTAPAYRTYHPGYLNRRPNSLGFAPLKAAVADAIGL